LVVLNEEVEEPPARKQRILWRCLCDCGNTVTVRGFRLREGWCRSCGCEFKKFRDLTGLRFGRLQVMHRDGEDDSGFRWRCVCDCGSTVTVSSYKLQQGVTQSCGCYRQERMSEMVVKAHWDKVLALLPEQGEFYELK